MKQLILCTLLFGATVFFSACGSGGAPSPGPGTSPPSLPGPAPAVGDLTSLGGKSAKDVSLAILSRLAGRAQGESRDELARDLDEKWKLHCEEVCTIEGK